MTRFFEALGEDAFFEGDDQIPRVNEHDLAFDLDVLMEDYLSQAATWDLDMLPEVEPPSEPMRERGRVLADFTFPKAAADKRRELLESQAWTLVEEWVEGTHDEGRWADGAGAIFTRVDESTAAIGERRQEMVARRSREGTEEETIYRAVLVLYKWRTEDAVSRALFMTGTYDWLFSVSHEGSIAGWFDLEAGGRSMDALPDAGRKVWESLGMDLLLPFLYTFALLACENVSAEPAAPAEGWGPCYLRPAVRPLYSRSSDDAKNFPGWEIGAPSGTPGRGKFDHMDHHDGLPDGLNPGLYWIRQE